MNKGTIKYFLTRIIPSIALLLLLQVIQVQGADPGQSCYCFDGTFTSNWSSTKIVDTTAGSSATFTSSHMPNNGSPADYRQTEHNYGPGAIIVAHLNNGCIYDPATQGAITKISYSYNLRHFKPPVGQAVGYRLLIYQNSTYYGGPMDQTFDDSWDPFSNSNLVTSSFVKISGSGPSTPSFSVGQITFGYITANSNPNSTGQSKRISGIDNWCVRLETQPPPTDPCCPPWDVNRLKSMMFYKGSGSISAPYVLQFLPTFAFKNQMQLYSNYLNSINPAINKIVIYWDLRDQGTGTSPNPILGTPIDTTISPIINRGFVKWDAPSTGSYAALDPLYFLFSANEYPMKVGTWYVVHTYIYLNDKIRFWPEKCDTNDIYVRVQVQPKPVLEFSDGKSVIKSVSIK